MRREIRARKAAPEPEGAPGFRSCLGQVEPRELDQTHAAGEGFRDPAHQRRRCTAEHQKPRRIAGPIDEHAKRLEQRRLALYLVDDHEAGQTGQRLLRRLQPPPIHGALEVEERAVPRSVGRNLARKGGLAALARPCQGDRGMDGERLVDTGAGGGSVDVHASFYSLKILIPIADFQGKRTRKSHRPAPTPPSPERANHPVQKIRLTIGMRITRNRMVMTPPARMKSTTR